MKYLRFPDLAARGIVNSRMTLKRLIDGQGFPPGVLLTPNARAWTEAEVNEWLASRPVARKPTTNSIASHAPSHGEAA
jgi:predicted DNA-binding transcriptional regulator AlpA